jgi:hypothetical protein
LYVKVSFKEQSYFLAVFKVQAAMNAVNTLRNVRIAAKLALRLKTSFLIMHLIKPQTGSADNEFHEPTLRK